LVKLTCVFLCLARVLGMVIEWVEYRIFVFLVGWVWDERYTKSLYIVKHQNFWYL
jgi:hypothetical protein